MKELKVSHMAKKICILFSSGLDSVIMRHYAKVKYPEAEVKCIYYKHGADAEDSEIKNLPSYVEVRTVDWLNEKCRPLVKASDPTAGPIYIPGRNLVFATLAACQELADEIWLGTLVDEAHPKATDKNEEFRTQASDTLSYVLSPFIDKVILRFPFVEEKWTKVESVRWALDNNLPKQEILDSVSCWYHANGQACGKCRMCFRRQLVFRLNGLEEECAVNPLSSPEALQMVKDYMTWYLVDKTSNSDETVLAKMLLTLAGRNNLPKETLDLVNSISASAR